MIAQTATHRSSLLYHFVLGIITLASRTAMAGTYNFSPISCSSPVSIPWRFSSDELEWDWVNIDNYANWIHQSRYVVANQYVDHVNWSLASMSLEYNYDFLRVGEYGTGLANYTGQAFGTFGFDVSQSLQATPGIFIFDSDYSVNQAGFVIDSVTLFCSTVAHSNPTQIGWNTKYSGFLLGDGDVVYFQAPGSIGAGNHDTVILWGDNAAGYDFDLYARCGSLPTSGAYDYHSVSSLLEEFISLFQTPVSGHGILRSSLTVALDGSISPSTDISSPSTAMLRPEPTSSSRSNNSPSMATVYNREFARFGA